MRVFVTGAAGQLGYDVVNECHKRGLFVLGVDIRSEDEMLRRITMLKRNSKVR